MQVEKRELARQAGVDVKAKESECVLADQSGGLTPEGAGEVSSAAGPPDYSDSRWIPAAYWNYTDGRSQPVSKLIVHTVQGSASSCINWFQNEASDVSANYVVSNGGIVTQMVRDHDTPWHVGRSNPFCWGVEHEGWVDDGTPPSEAMLQASARLFAYACERFKRSPDTDILGHRDVPGTHTDPGNEWPMARFRQLVKSHMGIRTPTPEAPVLTPLWVNWAYLTRWGKKQAEACVAALHKHGVSSTLPTKNVVKAADDALDGVKGNHPCVVLGRNAWKVLPAGQRNKVETAMEEEDPYRYDLWYADSGEEVRWRLAKIAALYGANVGEVLADYKAELDGETPEPPAGTFTPGPDTGKAHMRGVYNLVGAERYSFTKLKAWAKTHGAHKRVYEFIDVVERVWKEAWPVVGAPMYAADMAIVQFCHETGFGHYRGDSVAWNPAGIKKAGRRGDTPADFEVPATAYEGARMLLNHMSIYIGGKPFGKVHGRYAEVRPIRWRSAATVDGLTGTWATDPKYATILRKYLLELEGDTRGGDMSRVDRGLEKALEFRGIKYGYWTWQRNFVLWADGIPSVARAREIGGVCSSVPNVYRLVNGLDTPSGGKLKGGTGAWFAVYAKHRLTDLNKSYPAGTLFMSDYRGEATHLQGHVAVSGEARVNPWLLQSDTGLGWNDQRRLKDTQAFAHFTHYALPEEWLG